MTILLLLALISVKPFIPVIMLFTFIAMVINYRISLPWNILDKNNMNLKSGKHMGNLLIHAVLFIFSIFASAAAVFDYGACTELRAFRVALFDILAYHLSYLIFIAMATINFSYFSYQLAILLNGFRTMNVFFFYVAFEGSTDNTLYLMLSANVLKTLYTIYILLVFWRDVYQFTFKRFGSNVTLYSK